MTEEKKKGEGGQPPKASESTSQAQGQDPPGSTPGEGSSSKKGGEDSPGGIEEIVVGAGEGAIDYQHPLLKGKSAKEIEAIVTTQERALAEQNRELNKLQTEKKRQPAAPAPGAKVEGDGDEKPYGDDFLTPRFKRLEGRLGKMLQDTVAPLVEHTRTTGANTTREKLRTDLKHFGQLEPHIDQMIREQDGDPSQVDEGQLRYYYYAAVGIAQERGINLGNASAPASGKEDGGNEHRREEGAPVNIPQHRPSSAPLPKQRGEGEVRQLTEHERRLASLYFPVNGESIKTVEDQHREYRRLQDAEIDDVVLPGFSKENW